MQIYLDYSATTPPRPEAIAEVAEVAARQWGNPSSLHAWGQQAALALETARDRVAALVNAPDPASIVFTSGGTEADNLAIAGIARQYPTPQHLIISSVEHSAVEKTAQALEARGWQVTRLPVDIHGRVNPLDLEDAIGPRTVLVSIIYGQSEVGTLQPIAELARIARERGVCFHTDAVQVAGRLPIDASQLPVDLLSLSSHKLYGPQGVGALYVRPGIKFAPLFGGGGQERGWRSGTQAVPAIAGFGVAAELAAAELPSETPRLIALRDRLFARLEDCPVLLPTGDRRQRLPHHASFCLLPAGELAASYPMEWRQSAFARVRMPEVTGRTLVRELNLAGIGISAGSACHSGKLDPSPILTAMGYSPAAALGGIRLTLGRATTEADIDWTAMALRQILARLNLWEACDRLSTVGAV